MSEQTKIATRAVLERLLSDGPLGTNLTAISYVAQENGLRISRQDLHNWHAMVHAPSPNLLDLYWHIITDRIKTFGYTTNLLVLQKLIRDLKAAAANDTTKEN